MALALEQFSGAPIVAFATTSFWIASIPIAGAEIGVCVTTTVGVGTGVGVTISCCQVCQTAIPITIPNRVNKSRIIIHELFVFIISLLKWVGESPEII